jgi:hypothetical protein
MFPRSARRGPARLRFRQARLARALDAPDGQRLQ